MRPTPDPAPQQVRRPVLDLVALERWNYENKRAREDYRARPSRICRMPDCTFICADDNKCCRGHRSYDKGAA